jgi:hypothetical protein
MFGFKLERRRGAVTVGLLTTCDERLLEKAADRFATVEAKMAGTSGETEELLWKR